MKLSLHPFFCFKPLPFFPFQLQSRVLPKSDNGNNTVDMGGDLKVKEGQMVKITVRFKSPQKNNNGDPVKVDHVDLISS